MPQTGNPYDDLVATAAPAPAASANPYDDLVAPVADGAQLRASVSQASSAAPQTVAARRALAKYVGLPGGVADAIPDEIKRMATVKRVTEDTSASPTLQKAFADPQFAQVAHDDSGPLSAVASAIKWLVSAPGAPAGGLVGAVRAVGSGAPTASAGLYGAAAAPFELLGQVPGAGSAADLGAWLRGQQKNAQAVAAQWSGQDPNAGLVERGVMSGLQSAGQNLAMLPLGLANTARLTGEQLMLGAMGVVTGGQTYGKARDAGKTPAEAIPYAAQDAVAEVVTEKFAGAAGLLKQIKAGAGAAKLFAYELLKEVPGEMGATLWQNFNEWANLNPEKSVSDWLAEQPAALVETAIATLVGGSVQIGAVKSVQKFAEKANGGQALIDQADAGAQGLTELFKRAADAQTRVRDVDTFAQLVQQMADEGKAGDTPTAVYVDGRALAETLQANPEAAQVFNQMPEEVRAQVAEAVATGGAVELPIGELTARAAGTALEAALLPHLRTTIDGLSQTEAKEAAKVYEQELQQHAERVIAESEQGDAVRAEGEQIRQLVQDAQVASGRVAKGVAEVNARLHEAFFTAMSSRAGVTPMELFKQFDLKVQGAQGAGYEQADARDLMLTHNLTAANLLHAKKMGGIPVPSLAVTKKDTPLDGFGEITLIGPKELADPKGYAGTKVFSADIYSPRYPSVERELEKKQVAALEKKLQPMADKLGEGLPDTQSLQREGQRELERNTPMMATFLKEAGIEPAVVAKKSEMTPERIARLKSFGITDAQLAQTDRFALVDDPAFVKAAVAEMADTYRSAGSKYVQKLADELEADEGAQRDAARDTARQIATAAQDAKNPTPDKYATQRAIEKQIDDAGLRKAYEAHVKAWLDRITKSERIFQGFTDSGNRKYTPHTLENVVKILKKELRGGESFNYGVGSLRAKFTPEFKSLDAIRKAKGRLVSAEDFEKVKKEVDAEFSKLGDLMGVSKSDTLTAILEDAPKMGLERAAKDFNVTLTPEAKQAAVDFLNKLRDLPTAYFEAKVLREVSPAEFKGAVVPEDIDPDALAYLKTQVSEIRTYKRGDEAGRAAALQGFTDLFFQDQQGPRGTFDPSTNTIALLQSANLSTFLHESAHFFLEVMSDLASRPNAPAQVREDMDRILKWFGVKGDESVVGEGAAGGVLEQGGATYPEFLPIDKLTQEQMLARGADGFLTEARERYIPIDKIDGREPVPDASDERGYQPGRPVTQPIEVVYDRAADVYMIYGGNHRLHQVEVNGHKYIRAFVQPDGGTVGKSATTIRSKTDLPAGVFAQDGQPTAPAPEPTVKRTPLETWRAMTLDQKRPYHERWAESFEQYLLEGKAPSLELRGPFQRFRSFLNQVYKSLKDFLAGRQATPGGQAGVFEQGVGALADVLVGWDTAGIKSAVSERRGVITVGQIVVPEGERGTGKGTAAMQALLDYADRTGQRVALTPSPDFGGSKPRLVKFYKGLGFKENKGRAKDYEISEAMVREPSTGGVFNQSAYHGTPHRFDKFTTAAMGTGEGAQAFGWGLYFASKKEIAEHYRNVLSGQNISIDGEAMQARKGGRLAGFAEEKGLSPRQAEAIDDVLNNFVPNRSAATLEEALQNWRDAGESEATAKLVEGLADRVKITKGQLYEVEVPESHEMLHWEKPLSEQPDAAKLREIAAEEDMPVQYRKRAMHGAQTGQDFYKALSQALGSDKAASQVLESYGIKGIDFPAQSLSGGAEDGARNFVVFGDDDVTIKQTFYQRDERNPLGLTDEIRRVMDRMLATDEQIAAAEEYAGLMPDADATEVAKDKLNARSIRDLKWAGNAKSRVMKELQAKAKSVRREVRMEARREIMSQDVYRAWTFLTANVTVDDQITTEQRKSNPKVLDVTQDSLLVAIAKLGGIRRDSAAGDLGVHADDLTTKGGVFGKPPFRKDGGLSADGMGEALMEAGYLLPDENGRHDLRDLEEAIDSELRGSPVYSIAKDYSTGPERAGEGLNLGALNAGRFDLAGLRDAGVQADVIARLEALRMVRKDGGIHPDLLADVFNYPGGEELANAIARAEPPLTAVEGRTDQLMLERYGDLVDQRAIEAAALEAVHNDVRARALATELKAQQEMLGAKVGSANTLAKAAQTFAEGVVSNIPLGMLKRKSWAYLQAERRAGKAWQTATAAGKTEDAVAAKRDQVLNNAVVREIARVQAEIEKTKALFARVTKGNDEKVVEKGRDPDIVNAARAVLQLYGVASASTKKAAAYMDAVGQYDLDMAKHLRVYVERAEGAAKPMDRVTVDELRMLREDIQTLWDMAKRSRQMEIDGNLIDLEDAEQEVLADVDRLGVPAVMPGELSAPTARDEAALKLQFGVAVASRVEQWAKMMGPAVRRYIFGRMNRATVAYTEDSITAQRKLQELFETIAPTLKRGSIAAPEIGYTFGKADGSGVGPAELLHAILHTGNESNLRKLLLGRKWATENADGTLNTGPLPDGRAGWDAFMQRMYSEGVITKAHMDFVQGVWDLNESLKEKAQKAHRDVFGRYFATITAQPVQTPFGEYRGGYVPAKVDPRLVKDNAMRKLAEAENEAMTYAFPGVGKGFTQSRVENYTKPLLLDLRVLSQHINSVVLFSNMAPAHSDVKRLLSRKGLSSTLAKAQPAVVEGMLIPWLSRTASQSVTTPIMGDGGLARFFSVVRGRAGMSLMMANVINAAQQVPGALYALTQVKGVYLRQAVAEWVKNPKAMSKAVAEADPFMKHRLEGEMVAIHEAVNEILIDPNIRQRADAWTAKHAYFLQSLIDNMQGPVVWTAAYNEALAGGQSEQDAKDHASGVVRMTLGSNRPIDVSRIETGTAPVRFFSQFMGYFNMVANTSGRALQEVANEFGIRPGAGKMLYIVAATLATAVWVPEMIGLILKGGAEDKDRDGWLDDWLMAVFGAGTVKGLTGMVPFGGAVAQAAVNRFNDSPADDRISLSPAVSMIESAVASPASLYKAMAADGSAQKATKDSFTALALLVNPAFFVVGRPASYLAGMVDDKINPTSPVDAARGLVTGAASPESKAR